MNTGLTGFLVHSCSPGLAEFYKVVVNSYCSYYFLTVAVLNVAIINLNKRVDPDVLTRGNAEMSLMYVHSNLMVGKRG